VPFSFEKGSNRVQKSSRLSLLLGVREKHLPRGSVEGDRAVPQTISSGMWKRGSTTPDNLIPLYGDSQGHPQMTIRTTLVSFR
jgi:hypothetical protein